MNSAIPTLPPSDDECETRRLVWAWLVSWAVVIGGALVWIVVFRPENAARVFPLIFGLATLPGKYLIFAGLSKEVPLGPWSIAMLATVVDIATALTFVVGLEWMENFAWAERTLKRLHDQAHKVLDEFPRLKRMAFFGVVLFVFLPLPASGAIGGTFVGQFLGLSRASGVFAVTLGGALVSIIFGLLATFVGAEARTMLENPWLTGTSIVVFAIFGWFAWRRTRQLLRKR